MVSQNSALLAPIAVDAVMKVMNPASPGTVDLRDIRVVKKVGGTIDESELVEGLVLSQRVASAPGAVTRVEKAKIGLIQFCLSAPKTDASFLLVFDTLCSFLTRWRIKMKTEALFHLKQVSWQTW